MKNWLYLFSLLFAVLVLMSFVYARNFDDDSKKVKIFVSWPGTKSLPHYNWESNKEKPEGIEPTLIEELLELANIEYEYVKDFNFSGNGDPRIEALVKGDADISIRGITVTDERKKDVLFTKSYYSDGLSAMVRSDSEINNLADLGDKKIFVHDYTTAYDWVKHNIENCKLITFNKSQDYISPEQLLIDGKIDAYVIDYTYLKRIEGQYASLRVLTEKFTKESLAIAVKKERKDLVKKINKALLKMSKSGRLDEILSQFDK